MAEVTGPVSTLAGARHPFPKGTMCDLHPDRLAVARIQGETDLKQLEEEVMDVLLKALDKGLPIEEICDKASDAWVESFRC